MNALAAANAAYGQAARNIKPNRAIEYDIFAQITARLRASAARLPEGFPALVKALDDNRALWIALASDLSLPDNPLPIETKIGLLNLAQFSLEHTGRILAGQANVEPLIDINRAIMKGLNGQEASK
jgi:flagellar biosynthesis activator protein FlaF